MARFCLLSFLGLFVVSAWGDAVGYTIVNNQTYVTLNNGLRMPQVGLGTFNGGGPGRVHEAVKHAIRFGYRHIDTAIAYGIENEIGEALTQIFAEGVVKREDLWITSKLPNGYHASADVEKALDLSLESLKLDYLDLFMIHWPVTQQKGGDEVTPSLEETWLAMEKLVKSGRVKSIGVSNYSIKKLNDILSYASIRPAVVQNESHPKFRQHMLLQYCRQNNIHFTAYAPLGSMDHPGNKIAVMQLDEVRQVASETNKSPGQVLIRYQIDRGISVIPKSTSASHIAANFDVFDFHLSWDQLTLLNSVEPQERVFSGDFQLRKNGPYKTLHDLWDGDENGDEQKTSSKK